VHCGTPTGRALPGAGLARRPGPYLVVMFYRCWTSVFLRRAQGDDSVVSAAGAARARTLRPVPTVERRQCRVRRWGTSVTEGGARWGKDAVFGANGGRTRPGYQPVGWCGACLGRMAEGRLVGNMAAPCREICRIATGCSSSTPTTRGSAALAPRARHPDNCTPAALAAPLSRSSYCGTGARTAANTGVAASRTSDA
jgi:hypothetical protein